MERRRVSAVPSLAGNSEVRIAEGTAAAHWLIRLGLRHLVNVVAICIARKPGYFIGCSASELYARGYWLTQFTEFLKALQLVFPDD